LRDDAGGGLRALLEGARVMLLFFMVDLTLLRVVFLFGQLQLLQLLLGQELQLKVVCALGGC